MLINVLLIIFCPIVSDHVEYILKAQITAAVTDSLFPKPKIATKQYGTPDGIRPRRLMLVGQMREVWEGYVGWLRSACRTNRRPLWHSSSRESELLAN
ncbi:hypothetical protein EDD18DRAFT_1148966 [Armillaria luteobubalina]|uniref:Uncharacterized protein n=1 Tax=Armillaria luteobubalina TaxID=153913 RepID=A0AA39QDA5_9AGAR|nr:hypothetical protein EDD18DRAFT_1148966 [Armillaria luteobubalina]